MYICMFVSIQNSYAFYFSRVHSHHLCTQVHLCLARCKCRARRTTKKNSLLGYAGGSRTNTLGPADQLGCCWGVGKVDLKRKHNYVKQHLDNHLKKKMLPLKKKKSIHTQKIHCNFCVALKPAQSTEVLTLQLAISRPKSTQYHYNGMVNMSHVLEALETKDRKLYLLWPEWILFAGLKCHFVKSFDDQL